MFPRNENRNEGTFGCPPERKTRTRVRSDVPLERKTETRVHSPKPPFYETALLSPGELWIDVLSCEVAGLLEAPKPPEKIKVGEKLVKSRFSGISQSRSKLAQKYVKNRFAC